MCVCVCVCVCVMLCCVVLCCVVCVCVCCVWVMCCVCVHVCVCVWVCVCVFVYKCVCVCVCVHTCVYVYVSVCMHASCALPHNDILHDIRRCQSLEAEKKWKNQQINESPSPHPLTHSTGGQRWQKVKAAMSVSSSVTGRQPPAPPPPPPLPSKQPTMSLESNDLSALCFLGSDGVTSILLCASWVGGHSCRVLCSSIPHVTGSSVEMAGWVSTADHTSQGGKY